MANTRRMSRYKILRNNGFVNFEAAVLSNVPLDVPYMKDLISNRKSIRAKAIEDNRSEEQYYSMIQQHYIDNGHFKPAVARRKARIDVWKMLRSWEKMFRDKYPNYESPWQKKRRQWVSFMDKAEKALAHQHGFID